MNKHIDHLLATATALIAEAQRLSKPKPKAPASAPVNAPERATDEEIERGLAELRALRTTL
jgi:hypothetical protein